MYFKFQKALNVNYLIIYDARKGLDLDNKEDLRFEMRLIILFKLLFKIRESGFTIKSEEYFLKKISHLSNEDITRNEAK